MMIFYLWWFSIYNETIDQYIRSDSGQDSDEYSCEDISREVDIQIQSWKSDQGSQDQGRNPPAPVVSENDDGCSESRNGMSGREWKVPGNPDQHFHPLVDPAGPGPGN